VAALVVSLLCLALNAFFVAAEFALVKVRASRIAPLARRGDRRAIAAEKVLTRLDRYLSVTQLGITVASLGLGWIAEPAIEKLADRAALSLTGRPLGSAGHVAVDVVGLGVLTYLHLLLGELVPKFIAIQHPEKTALVSALPLRFVNAALRPLLWVLEHSQAAVLRMLGMHAVASEGELSVDEILHMLAASTARSPAARETQRLVERIVRLGRKPVRNAMVPRVDVFTLPVETTGEEAYEAMRRAGFSRIPLTSGLSRDAIVGYVYAKDLFLDPASHEAKSLERYVRKPLFVPEARYAASVVRDMQRERTHFAVVVDEYGGTSGIVTLEDLVEEVFGAIQDELDTEAPLVEARGERTWDVDATATTDILAELGIPIEEEDRGEPLAHAVMRRLGHLPRLGEVVTLGPGVEAEVRKTGPRRVERLRVRMLGTADASRSHDDDERSL
jgi:CBS domain containing-hemolysin-like protein